MSRIYNSEKIWLTIDVEELVDSNFNIKYKSIVKLDYNKLIDNWLDFCDENNIKSTAFVLGSFAKKYPDIIRKIHNKGHEIACHGEDHRLVYKYDREEWYIKTNIAKSFLEELINDEVKGYRSPSWSLPYDKEYYEDLIKMGFTYSSSYFPFKTYMYGHSEDKKKPFTVFTDKGEITEIPLAKFLIPFSGGFYLRLIPTFLQKMLIYRLAKITKVIIYIHPYELDSENMFFKHLETANFSKDFFLAFYSSSSPKKKIKCLLESIKLNKK